MGADVAPSMAALPIALIYIRAKPGAKIEGIQKYKSF